jgi:SAM-dependent methyltransferase
MQASQRVTARGADVDRQAHWERIYRAKATTELSWYQSEAKLSLELIQGVAPRRDEPIIDVGGGTSPLVDGLLSVGYTAVTVLDLAHTALAQAQTRLGPLSAAANWIEADVLEASLPPVTYAVWHDRAVFHFLTNPADRRRYVAQVRHAVRSGGYVIVASFAPDGPTHCSRLEVARYAPNELHAQFGGGFQLLGSTPERHRTPSGSTQAFVYCLCRVEGATTPR